MAQHERGRNIKMLVGLMLFATGYSCLLYYWHTLTGMNMLDGIIGVVLGLYICSHPAANLLDMLLYGRYDGSPGSSRRFDVLWLALNMLVMVIGWVVIVIGMTLFVDRTT